MNDEESIINITNENNRDTVNSHILISPPNIKKTFINDIKNQKLIFPLLVNGIIISAAFINIRYLRFIYTNKNDLDAQLYLTLFFLMMIIFCYFKASLTSPVQSDVDKYFNFSLVDQSKGNSIINIDLSRYKSKCEFCNKFKFERTSHCRVCNTCVLRRDHHCVWIGNCVGLNNNQYFFNFCTWVVISLFFYLRNFVNFMWNYKILVSKDFNLELGYINGFLIITISILLTSTFFGVFGIWGQQVFYTFNDLTFLERKRTFAEEYYCCIMEKNENKMNNPYNKGFILNYFYVIGPTLFHLLFPLPKFLNKHPMPENSPLFAKVKQTHPFCVHNYLKHNNFPGIIEAWEVQLNAMNPNNFMNLAKQSYLDKFIN